ncbi:tannase and feruloyl esterase [Mycena rosella]|uniref:Carboxylic ester hydrolase n=1 Tax=Mycena rosella TaxID=1033263 RepID=A0AAD7CNG8_MYCRO|nr:tannase and feruloyl esterase [Mycena rosella]
MARLLPLIATAVLFPLCVLATDPPARCLALQQTLHLENTTILNVTYVDGPTIVATPGVCQSTASTSVPLCRVQFVINTTSTSAVHAEAWLPDTWFGRFIGTGNGGVGGCIDYQGLDYGTSLHFASVGSDNGHDGASGLPFLNHPEVINDFAFRAVHLEAVIGKQIVQAYYGTPAAKSYYMGCSTGGRQGTTAALKFPGDFDGILAGSPATDFNHLAGWLGWMSHAVGAFNHSLACVGLLTHLVGSTDPSIANVDSPSFIPPALWEVVSAEILRQCDALDGLVDGIIAEPDNCDFLPDILACEGGPSSSCLTGPQLQALKNTYSPLLGTDGELIYPRYSPGAEADSLAASVFGGIFGQLTADWERYAVLNVTEHNFTDFGLADIARFDEVNPGDIESFELDMSEFRDRGGKFVTYHGRRDPLISSTHSKVVYDRITHTLGTPSLDGFYRLFLVPGMSHCYGGIGAPAFGQGPDKALNVVNASSHNILLALVDWVEGGVAPATIIGSGANDTGRTHCRYPMESKFNGLTFVCL